MMPHRDPDVARKYRQERYLRLKESDPGYSKRMYQKHREKRLAALREWRALNGDEVRAKARAKYAKNRELCVERARNYRRLNREEVNAKAMAKYYANRDLIKERVKGYRKKHYTKIYARIRRWLKQNPEKAAIMNAKRIISEQTSVPSRKIPKELAQVKIEQLKVSRLVRELRVAEAA